MEENDFVTVYNKIYTEYVALKDKQVIEKWKYHQKQSRKKNDYDWTAFEVCEDILRQRENSYIDTTYPRD